MTRRRISSWLASVVSLVGFAFAQHGGMMPPEVAKHLGKAQVYSTETIRATRYIDATTKDSMTVDGRNLKIVRVQRMGNTDFVALHFGKVRDIGGLVITWNAKSYPSEATIYISTDDTTWTQRGKLRKGNDATSVVYLPDVKARALTIDCGRRRGSETVGVNSLRVIDADSSSSVAEFYRFSFGQMNNALVPAFYRAERTGPSDIIANDCKIASLFEDGSILSEGTSLLIQPGINSKGINIPVLQAKSSNDALSANRFQSGDLAIEVHATQVEREGKMETVICYVLTNIGKSEFKGRLALGCYPTWVGAENQKGISKMVRTNSRLEIDDRAMVSFVPSISEIGTATPSAGDVSNYVQRGTAPAEKASFSASGHCSGGASMELVLAPGTAVMQYVIVSPLKPASYYSPLDEKELESLFLKK